MRPFYLTGLRVAGIQPNPALLYFAQRSARRLALVISIAVHGAPYASASSRTALRFAESALRLGHRIHRVFFYHDGVLGAAGQGVAPQDEEDLHAGWVRLGESHGVELAVCIANALKRGVLDEAERDRYEKEAVTAHPAFTIVGLGQLIEAMTASDRFVTFAA